MEDVREDRFYLLRTGLETIRDYPMGLGYTAERLKYIQCAAGIPKPAHNFIMGYLITYGLVGGSYLLFVWLSGPFTAARRLFRNRLKDPSLLVALLCGVCSYLTYNLAHASMNWIPFWLFWGIMLRAVQLSVPDDAERRRRHARSKDRAARAPRV